MAMTGGKAYLVRDVAANYGNASWRIKLYVYVKELSRDIEKNTTTLSLGMYVVTPSGYDIGPWYDSSGGSYVGTATSGANCKTFDGDIANFSGTKWLVENQNITVTHDADGTKTATIYWKWNVNSPWGQYVTPSGNFNHTITTIPRATTPTVSATSANMGSSITISMPRASSAFTHNLSWKMGTEGGEIGSKLGTSKSWPIPYDLAKAIPNAKSGTCTITCETWSGDTLIGTKTVTFTAKVPDNSNTKPTVSCVVSPVSSLGEGFAGLYIQGKTKVKTDISAEGKYEASIKTYYSTVANTGETTSPSGKTYTHPAPVSSGVAKVTYSAYDSREIGNTGSKNITVLPYSQPAVIPYTGENSIICERCTADGTLSPSGTYIRIKAGRQYSPVISGGKQYNYCILRYRYKVATAPSYSSWVTLIAKNSTGSDVVDIIVGNIATSLTTSYDIQINVADDIDGSHTLNFPIPTDDVNFHEREGGDGAAFGKYSEEAKKVEIAEGWDLKYYGERWKDLGVSSNVSNGSSTGHTPTGGGCYYRVEGENHVFVAFNCAFNYAGSLIQVNAAAIPSKYRPKYGVQCLAVTGGRAIARIRVNAAGNVFVDWVQNVSSAEDTTAFEVTWIDGYIDYWI